MSHTKSKDVVAVVAAPNPSDPVITAVRTMGFKTVRVGRTSFTVRPSASGPIYGAPSFFSRLNRALQDDFYKGDKTFVKPRFDGRSMYSQATVHGVLYVAEIVVGFIHFTKVKMKPKTKAKQEN